MNLIKQLIELIKENNQYKRDYRRLENANLDYNALQNMVNTVSGNPNNIVIEIKMANGTTLIIRKETKSDSQYVSFADRYKEAHK